MSDITRDTIEGIPEEPYNRIEQYLDAITRDTIEGIPEEPYNRIEQYLDYLARNGGGGIVIVQQVTQTEIDSAIAEIWG